ncbi:MAG: FAD-dependent oxidoreductase [Comamonadaceae bacterium]|nr:MAG: FAD-dependent oxidoreductase [Comamonadaceae bacterium]
MTARLSTTCCIAGGGPAGLMLALLLARAGVQVTVLEKHDDFLRDFRGDTVHPSTLQIMHELGLLEAFLKRPHDEVRTLEATIGGTRVTVASFSRVPTRCRFIAMMPQWDFLDFVRDEAARYPGFRLMTGAEVTSVIQEAGRVTGVRASTFAGPLEVSAQLVIGADGRRSAVRASAGLVVRDIGAPIDVLWMRLPRHEGDSDASGGRLDTGYFMAMINRQSYWQCAYVIAKGGIDAIRSRGIEAFRQDIVRAAPMFEGRTGALASWDDVKLLSVTVDRLEQWWKPGLLCIGDAAHAMSPIGGVGINLAIQDAVAAANLLAAPLAAPTGFAHDAGDMITPLLARVQRRRMWPTRLVQSIQVMVQDRLLNPVVSGQRAGGRPMAVPAALKLLDRFPLLSAIPAYFVGVGVRPEHVRSPRQAGAGDSKEK